MVLAVSLIFFGISSPANAATPKAGAACKKAGQTAIAKGKKFTCVKSGKKSGKKLRWNKGVAVAKSAPTPTAPTPGAPTPVAPTPVAPTPTAPTPGAPTPTAPTPVAPTPTAPTPVAPTSTIGTTPWGYLSIIGSGNGLGNVADASLVQTSSGDIRVYFKNGNEPQANISGFDNYIHSALSKDGGKTWSIESGVRIQVTSPVEVLPKTGGGYQAWGWKNAPGGDYLYYAESSDGLTFTEISIPGIDGTKCLTSTGVAMGPLFGDPTIAKLSDGTWLMHLQGFGVGNTGPQFARWACVATSPDGKTWTPVQSRSYGGTVDVETNPHIYMNKSGKVEWMWPNSLGVATRIGDGTTYGNPITYIKAGDPERLDLADGTELYAMGGFDHRGGGVLIFAKRITNSYQIASVTGGLPPTGKSPNAVLTWTVKGATESDISVMNLCLNKKVSDISGATVTMTTSNGVVTVVSADPANEHPCVYILVGPEKIMG